MKAFRIGVVFVAILVVAAGVGFGIARAEGSHSESPVLNFQDQEMLGQDSYASPYVADPVETGNLPEVSIADSSIVEVEGNMHREGADTGDP
jgi:hypothetical protein